MRVLASDQARTFVRQRGGRLYVWTTGHRCCSGRLALLAADTARPPGWRREFDPIDAGGFDLFLDTGAHGVPQDLMLEVQGRRPRIRAF